MAAKKDRPEARFGTSVLNGLFKKHMLRQDRYSRRQPLNEKFTTWLATGFGTGLAPFAPGTFGTLVGIPLYLVFSGMPWPLQLLSVVAFTCLSVYVAGEAEVLFGQKDAQRIVIDEIAGFQWTMLLVSPTILHVILGFMLFRLFDITKPFPARFCQDRLPGGWGVVGDDVVAGIYGSAVLHIVIYYLMP